MKKYEDPIVEDVHRTRARLLQRHGGSEGYAEHLRELEIELADRLVSRERRLPVRTPPKVS
jgi:isopropylmalate/homocitrate/citramalate synthase